MVQKVNGFSSNNDGNGRGSAPKLRHKNQSLQQESQNKQSPTAVKDVSKPVTQIEVQGMSDNQLSALNKNEITKLVALLPKSHQDQLLPNLLSLEQLNVSVGRPIRAKIANEWREIRSEEPIAEKEYEHIINNVNLDHESKRGSLRAKSSDAGDEGSFHRIALAPSGNFIKDKVRDLKNLVQNTWAALRVGRPYVKLDPHLLDALSKYALEGKTIAIIGVPGAGKTTLLRGLAPVIAENKNVVIVEKDRYNEIAGNKTQPHSVLGKAQRVSISNDDYPESLRKTVANLGPEVLVTDEIKTEEQAQILRSAKGDGIGLIFTVHGNSITSVLQSKNLEPVTGGLQTMTVSDNMAREKNSGSKQVTELATTPIIDVAVVMKDKNTALVYSDYRAAADDLLNGKLPKPVIYPVGRNIDYRSISEEQPDIFRRKGLLSTEADNVGLGSSSEKVYQGNYSKKRRKQENIESQNATQSNQTQTRLSSQSRKK